MSEAARSAHLIGPAELQTLLAARPDTVVLDIRHVMPDSGAGHSPGTRSAPVAEFFDAAGFLLSDNRLRERLAVLGLPAGAEPAVYCGTGVAAAREIFVLSVVGIRARLDAGSASEWTADPSRVPVR